MAKNNPLEGRYKATVSDVDLGVVGEKGTVLLSVWFKPHAELVGADFVIGEFQRVKKPYFLSDKVISQGKSAGKTSIEVTANQIKESFGYTGPLELEALRVGLMNKEVELSCRIDPQTPEYTEVQYVNAPGSAPKGLKRLAPVPEDKLAKLAALWSGNAPVEKHVDPQALFASMVEKTEAAA
jgi:hypothetical protein